MTQGRCNDVEALVDREAHGWSDAERMRVERHLESCAKCQETLAVARLVRDTFRDVSAELSETARERAISRAFLRSESRAIESVQKRRNVLTLTLASFAAAAAVAL